MKFIKKWLFRKRLKNDWRLVDDVTGNIHWTDRDFMDTYYCFLFENGLGDRKVDLVGTGVLKNYPDRIKQSKGYLEIVYPWLKGRRDPRIKTYWQVKKAEQNFFVWELYKRLIQ